MIGNFNLMLWLGVVNFILVFLQVLGGLRIIKVKFKLHKTLGIILLFTAATHGILGLMNYF